VGLSKKFLAARGGKLLLLAGTDRLDKELMIGQMQGTLLRTCRRPETMWELISPFFSTTKQESTNSKSFPKQAILFMKTKPRKQPWCSLISIGEMTEVR
jgi:hypothetical protein